MLNHFLDHILEYIAIIVAFTSFIVSTCFAIKSLLSSRRANELSENQKALLLIALLSPACKSHEQWKLFIEFMASKNKIPSIINSDQQFLIDALARLEIKAEIDGGKIKVNL